MNSEEAYKTILHELISGGNQILNKEHDHDNFGNFLIAFVNHGKERSLVCDRGEIALCNDLNGNSGCSTVINSIYGITAEELIDVLSRI